MFLLLGSDSPSGVVKYLETTGRPTIRADNLTRMIGRRDLNYCLGTLKNMTLGIIEYFSLTYINKKIVLAF